MGFTSLRTKLVVLCVLLTTGTTGILGAYMLWESYQSLRVQAQQAQLALAKTLAWQVDQGISRAFQAVSSLSKRPEILAMEKGRVFRELSFVTSTTELLDGLLIVSDDGRTMAQSHPGLSKRDLPPARWFLENMKRVQNLHGTVLVDFYKTQDGNVGVVIASPLATAGEKGPGILAGVLFIPNHAIGNLEAVHIGETGYPYLVNEDGLAIIHPDKSKLLSDLSHNPSVKGLRSRGEGILQFRNNEGEEILSAFSPVGSAGWGVVVRQPAKECYAPADRMLKVMSAFLLLTLLSSALLSTLVARRVVRPILALAGKVERIETGRIETDIADPSLPRDEVGILNQSISKMAQRLEAQGRERERAHQRALQAEKKLSEAERLAAIGQLAAGLAHELNNPLSVISGSAQLARKAKGARLGKWLDRVEDESRRCHKLVSDLLDFAKPIKLRPAKTNLAKLARTCWPQVKAEDGPDHYSLRVNPENFQSRVDQDRFQQVFLNLMANALQAMPGGGTLKVWFERTPEAAYAFVEDEGQGFPPKNSEKIFRPFFSTKAKGTGLGLPIARSILQAHGGRLWAEAGPKGGARFILQWPEHPSKEASNV